MRPRLELSIVLPCLNEAETLQICVKKSLLSLERLGLSGEVVVADNGSTDGSQSIAIQSGARLIEVPVRGYGAALLAGIKHADGKFVIIGDADDSYELDNLKLFYDQLFLGFDLVMGNRFIGGIQDGAMPWLHRYVGNPILSFLGRLFFKVPINDFHCGLRGFNRVSILNLKLTSTGMEFASEMVVKASLNQLRITEVPTILKTDGRSRAPNLRNWRDGWRHLIFLLASSPRWLFLYPGMFLIALGILGIAATIRGEVAIGLLRFDSNTYLLSLGFFLVGLQTILMAILARVFSLHHGILPKSKSISRFERYFTLERGIVLGILLILTSILGLGILVFNWTGSGFSKIGDATSLRISGLFILTLSSGIQLLFASFFASMLGV